MADDTTPAEPTPEQLATESINKALVGEGDNKNDIKLDNSNAGYYNKILTADFLSGKNDIVDVITQYWWTTNKPVAQGDKISNVPFLYAIEYKQKYGVTLTNLLNNAYAIIQGGGNIGSNVIKGIGGVLEKTAEVLEKSLDSFAGNTISSAIKTGVTSLSGGIERLTSKAGDYLNLSDDFGGKYLATTLLNPYNNLYALSATGKKFCFPYFGNNTAGFSISNLFSSDGSTSLLSKSITEAMSKLANGVVAIAGDLQEFGNLLSKSTNSFTMYNIEKAKAFSFPTEGKKVTVRFPLFNTIEKDSWKQNYKFIVLFGLRNMLFRLNNVQYYPPLIYDVSIPGWGRLPLSYVSSFSVNPVGMTRVKNINMSFINNDETSSRKESTVIVPEAWVIQIEFQSLIADSANQVLSSIFDLPIEASVENVQPNS